MFFNFILVIYGLNYSFSFCNNSLEISSFYSVSGIQSMVHNLNNLFRITHQSTHIHLFYLAIKIWLQFRQFQKDFPEPPFQTGRTTYFTAHRIVCALLPKHLAFISLVCKTTSFYETISPLIAKIMFYFLISVPGTAVFPVINTCSNTVHLLQLMRQYQSQIIN